MKVICMTCLEGGLNPLRGPSAALAALASMLWRPVEDDKLVGTYGVHDAASAAVMLPASRPGRNLVPMSEIAAVPVEGARATALKAGRWWQLTLGVICMSMIANLQYGWTLFVNPIEDRYHWGLPAIHVAFTIFVLVETWLVPLEGYLVDKIGPKLVGVGSGILFAAALAINSYADSIAMLYLGSVVRGIGAGGVYGACVGNARKGFPDRRGLAP